MYSTILQIKKKKINKTLIIEFKFDVVRIRYSYMSRTKIYPTISGIILRLNESRNSVQIIIIHGKLSQQWRNRVLRGGKEECIFRRANVLFCSPLPHWYNNSIKTSELSQNKEEIAQYVNYILYSYEIKIRFASK